jgi:hypothetical protein
METEDRIHNGDWRRELVIAAAGLGVGMFVLPLAIYGVGKRILGDYSPDGGVLTLAEHIWSDLLAFEPAAWILVLSPYLVLQLGRFARRLWRIKQV